MCVGSGGWANIIEKFKKAKSYCDRPFEVRYQGRTKKIIPIKGEWIGDHLNGGDSEPCDELLISHAKTLRPPICRMLHWTPSLPILPISATSSMRNSWISVTSGSENWLVRTPRHSMLDSTRTPDELTGNVDMGRGLDHFTEGLSAVFQTHVEGLKTRRAIGIHLPPQ